MSFTSRLLCMALALPVFVAGHKTYALDITEPVTGPVDTGTTGGSLDENGDHAISNGGSVAVDGTPSTPGAALVIDHSDTRDVLIDGAITVNDRSDDELTDFNANNAIGVMVGNGAAVSGTISLGGQAVIELVDDKPRVDADEDGIFDGIHDDSGTYIAGRVAQDSGRIGVYVPQNLSGDLLALSGARISVTSDDGGGYIVEGDITGRINLSATINYLGADTSADASDDAVGVGIYGDVSGFVRQAGAVTAIGENVVGVRVSGDLSQSLQLEGQVSVSGFASTSLSSAGDTETVIDANELGSAEAGVKLTGNISEGVLVGGNVNSVTTPDETQSLQDISDARADSGDVTSLKTQPYHYDENRFSGTITSAGDAPALVMDGGTYGSVVERFVDNTNDGGDGTDDSLYLTQSFSYSHSLINRGTITANGLNDGYAASAIEIGRTAPTVLSGGLLNTGSISATAYNNDATAIALMGGADLQDGGRARGDVFLNEGAISAGVTTNVATKSGVTATSHTATAVTIDAAANLPTGAEFINRGQVSAVHTHLNADGEASTGTAAAFDFSTRTDAIALTQELLRNDVFDVGLGKYLGNGDLDLDSSGIVNDDGTASPDGFVTTADVVAPSIFGNILFGSGNDTLVQSAGTITGAIDFGAGANSFTLSSETAETATTSFSGTLATSGTLAISMSGLSSLTLDGQVEVGSVAVTSLSLAGQANLGATVDPAAVPGAALIFANSFSVSGEQYTFTPNLTGISADPVSFTIIETNSDLSALDATLNDRLSSEVGFIYNVELSRQDLGSTHAINADFSLKTADELNLNAVEAAAFPVVTSHFAANASLGTALGNLNDAESFAAAFDQILPQYGDGTMLSQAAMLEGANGAVSERLRLVTSGAQLGSHGWGQQFGGYLDRSATDAAPEIAGDGIGLAFGYDARVGKLDALGVFGHLMWSNADETTGNTSDVHAEMFGLGVYAAENFGSALWHINATLGTGTLRSERGVRVGTVSDFLEARWDTTQYAAATSLSVPLLTGKHRLRGEISADYYQLEHDDYAETEAGNTGLAMRVQNAGSSIATASVGLRGSHKTPTRTPEEISLSPGYFLGYRTILEHDPYEAQVSFVTGTDSFTLTAQEDSEDRALVGFSLAAANNYFAFEVGLRGEFGDDTEIVSGGASLRVNF